MLRRDLPPRHFAKLAREFPRIASLGFAGQHVYLVSDPELVRQVLVGSSRSVEKGPALRAAGLVLGDGLLTLPQAAHLRAANGISLKHSGHFLVVGSAGGALRERAMSAFIGTTTK